MSSRRSGFIWMLLGMGVYGICQWGMLVILAQYASVEIVGQFGLALAISAPVFQFLNLGLRALLGTDTKRQYDFNVYLRLRIVTALLSFVLIGVISFCFGLLWETTVIVLIVAIAKIAESVSDVLFGELQLLQRMDLVGRSLIFKGILTILVFYLGLNSGFGIAQLFWGMAASWTFLLFVYDARNVQKVRYKLKIRPASANIKQYKTLVLMALPLGFFAALTSLLSSIPRWFIKASHGEAAVGYFTALSYIVVVGMMVSTAMQQTVSPRLAQLYQKDRKQFISFMLKLLVLGGAVGSFGIIFAFFWGCYFLQLLYGDLYGNYEAEFVVLMVGGMAMYIQSYVNAGLVASRVIRMQGWQAALGVLVCLAFCAWLVPDYQVMGAAISLSVSLWVSLLFASAVLVRAMRK